MTGEHSNGCSEGGLFLDMAGNIQKVALRVDFSWICRVNMQWLLCTGECFHDMAGKHSNGCSEGGLFLDMSGKHK
jgi:hypothetical protein